MSAIQESKGQIISFMLEKRIGHSFRKDRLHQHVSDSSGSHVTEACRNTVNEKNWVLDFYSANQSIVLRKFSNPEIC